MYALYQQLKALVLGQREEELASKPAAEERPALKPERRYFTGEITSLNASSGMIDQQVRAMWSPPPHFLPSSPSLPSDSGVLHQ